MVVLFTIVAEKPQYGSVTGNETPTETPLEAYIHWKGYDRRLDAWIPYSLIRKLNSSEVLESGCVDYSSGTAATGDGTNVQAAVIPPMSPQGGVVFDHNHMEDGHEGDEIDKDYLREHHENTKFKTIASINIGPYDVECWYFSPYPIEVQNTKCLYLCQYCLSFFKHDIEHSRHRLRCDIRHPPGYEIYRDAPNPQGPQIAMWELDGALSRVYCENLCYLSKLFLDHKTLKHPVHLFLFYVITEIHPDGYQIVGYFSKEKYSRNNVSCILILPQHQKKGYGKYLINFSYALALKEGRRGTPERPLSDLGRVSYINYWRQCILSVLKDRDSVVIDELADELSFEVADIITTFNEAKMIVTNPVTQQQFIYLTKEFLSILTATLGKPSKPVIPNKLRWIPYDPFLGPFEYIAD